MDPATLTRLGGAARMGFGLLALAAPRAALGGDLGEHGQDADSGHYMTRLFGVRDLVVGSATARLAGSSKARQEVLLFNLATELGDLVAAGLEARRLGGPGKLQLGGAAFNAVGIAVWATALRGER